MCIYIYTCTRHPSAQDWMELDFISQTYIDIYTLYHIYNYTYIYIYISCDKPNKKQLPFGDGWNATHKHGDDLGMV